MKVIMDQINQLLVDGILLTLILIINEPRQFVNSINKSLNRAFIDMGWDFKSQTVKITSMWSVINNSGASNARHIHPNNFLSAAYYVKAPSNCGDIVFYDPRTGPVYRKPKIANDNKLNASEVSVKS